MTPEIKKPIIGFTCGDLNGIGIELIIKSLSDSRLLDFMVPVIFANNKCLNFYKKGLPEYTINYASINDLSKLNPKQVNVLNCWEEEVAITPGESTETLAMLIHKYTIDYSDIGYGSTLAVFMFLISLAVSGFYLHHIGKNAS